MVRTLLDTNICIAIIRGKADHAFAKLRRRKLGSVGISSITFAELEFGVAKSASPDRNAAALVQFVTPLEILPFDDAAAAAYGRVRAGLASAGTPIGPLDTLIAAHAIALRATLITHNTREFERVDGLKLEDWLA